MTFGPRQNPRLYEINARVCIERLTRRHGIPFTLGTLPDAIWKSLASRGFDLVWLMGVWRRSAGARRAALEDPGLRRAYDETLPGWSESDVGASPYAIADYTVEPVLGTDADLANLRRTLNREGIGLILDFVPNHLALDHPWVTSHPDRFVQGREEAVHTHPEWFFSPDGTISIAHGRDPNFPPWTDTAQVDFFSGSLREALCREILRIAETADGVRCDMAMLGLNDVFGRIWGETRGGAAVPRTEFWSEIIGAVRRVHPGFLFIGEVYWGLETDLVRLGFDHVYDKVFYDRLRHGPAGAIREHLRGSPGWQSVRFIENHDEARAATAFGRDRLAAATAILATVPGLRLFHDGQLEGRRVRLPVQLLREPEEPADPELSRVLGRLLQVTDSMTYHEGTWTLMETGGEVLAWSWRHDRDLKVVLVNFAPEPGKARLSMRTPVARDEMTGSPIRLSDDGDIDLGPWEVRLLHMVLSQSPS